MSRHRVAQPELQRVYVRPTLDRQHREASRDFFNATCRGKRYRPPPGTFDPLWLRLGMRANLITHRAGWVVSNPLYSDSLDRHPDNDPSLPGHGWLREVYRSCDRDLCVLPGVLATIEGRLEQLRGAETRQQQAGGRRARAAVPAQLELLPQGTAAPVFPKAPEISEADVPY